MTLITLRFLHITFMALWIGALSFVSGDVRRTISATGPNVELLAARLRSYNRMANLGGIVTIITGFLLIFEIGGFKVVPKSIHSGIIVAIAMMGVQGALISRNARIVAQELAKGTPGESLKPQMKKVLIGAGVFHTLWLVAVILMVFRYVL